MSEVVIDTNVLLVAEGMHPDVSADCVRACVAMLEAIRRSGTIVLDDGYRILREYQNKLSVNRSKRVGAAFLKWLMQHQRTSRVEYVSLTELPGSCFKEFPVAALQAVFDPPDRKFPAVANAHVAKPPVLQAADCKWLDWWQPLAAAGVNVEFLCPPDVCAFYGHKFPGKPVPALPP
jgi:hypothetical protein